MNILGADHSFFNTAFDALKSELTYAFKSAFQPDLTREQFFNKELLRSTAELISQPQLQTRLAV